MKEPKKGEREVNVGKEGVREERGGRGGEGRERNILRNILCLNFSLPILTAAMVFRSLSLL